MSRERKINNNYTFLSIIEKYILLISGQHIKSDYIIVYGIHVSSFQIIYACHKHILNNKGGNIIITILH